MLVTCQSGQEKHELRAEGDEQEDAYRSGDKRYRLFDSVLYPHPGNRTGYKQGYTERRRSEPNNQVNADYKPNMERVNPYLPRQRRDDRGKDDDRRIVIHKASYNQEQDIDTN